MDVGSSPVEVTLTSDFTPASSKKFLDIQATIECGFTLKCVRDMIRTYSLTQVFSSKISETFKNTFFTDNPTVTKVLTDKNCVLFNSLGEFI